ncbi:hypothetical protein A9G11_08340 [Gilliamella sp. wkB108]|uniref:hypothetical protein n=1 Tax=Gilliamella sp. wkB108 TaxID=3120256 RepID=UPI00080DC5C9|nr:hypothetical protein [Gilliamella apicola]OCG21202.1 hypothetical protein A9G11_08340 [Gilliamella apicola]
MDSEIVKRWIEAGKILGVNPTANILCPVCQQSFLKVQDVEIETDPLQIERHMSCDICGAYNALRMTVK